MKLNIAARFKCANKLLAVPSTVTVRLFVSEMTLNCPSSAMTLNYSLVNFEGHCHLSKGTIGASLGIFPPEQTMLPGCLFVCLIVWFSCWSVCLLALVSVCLYVHAYTLMDLVHAAYIHMCCYMHVVMFAHVFIRGVRSQAKCLIHT